MAISADSTRFAWLTAKLSEQRNKIADLLARMTGLTSKTQPGNMRPSVFGKFMAMLGQVADEREKELRLINRIEDIEAQHRFCREHNQLESVTPDAHKRKKPEPALLDQEPCAERPDNGFWWLIVALYMMAQNSFFHKKQQLNND